MPVPVDQAIVPRRLQVSIRALVFSCVCFVATSLGASAITLSFIMVVRADAGSPQYWSMAALLLMGWLASLLHMYRVTVAAILAAG